MESQVRQTQEKVLHPKSGWLMLFVDILLFAGSILLFVFSPQPGNDGILIAMIVGGIVAFILAVIFMCGLKTVNPNEALVLTLLRKISRHN